MQNTQTNTRKFKTTCCCIGKCGELVIYDCGDDDLEIGVSEKGKWFIDGKKTAHRWNWIHIDKKQKEKLIKFLQMEK